MSFPRFFLVLRARYRILLLSIVATMAVAMLVTLIMPKTYRASAAIVLNYKGLDPVSGHTMSANLMPGYMATQMDIINSRAIVTAVIDRLKLLDDAGLRKAWDDSSRKLPMKEWLADRLSRNLDVSSARHSSLLNIRFSDGDAQSAARLANAFAEEYQAAASRINAEPQLRMSGYFEEQSKALRSKLETAHEKLSRYQKDKGLVSVENRYDVETVRLNELASQLVAVQGQLMEAQSRGRQARAGMGESPDVAASPVVQNLKTAVAQAETKLAAARSRFTEQHPEYQKAQAELDGARQALARYTRSAASNVGSNANILEQRERELRSALDAQRAKVLQANQARDELAVLSREVESAQQAYDSLMQRFNSANLEGQSNRSDVAILSWASAPARAAFPRPLLNMALALVMGVAIGLIAMLMAEFFERHIRSPAEFSEVTGIPVLGTLTRAGTRPATRSVVLHMPRKLSAN